MSDFLPFSYDSEPIHPWVVDEADGRPDLLGLLTRREQIYDLNAMNVTGSGPVPERLEMSQLLARIDDIKAEEGLYPYDSGPIRRISKLI